MFVSQKGKGSIGMHGLFAPTIQIAVRYVSRIQELWHEAKSTCTSYMSVLRLVGHFVLLIAL